MINLTCDASFKKINVKDRCLYTSDFGKKYVCTLLLRGGPNVMVFWRVYIRIGGVRGNN